MCGLMQVTSERDELQQSLQELQQQRHDVMGQSREMGAKYDSMQEEVSALCSPHYKITCRGRGNTQKQFL